MANLQELLTILLYIFMLRVLGYRYCTECLGQELHTRAHLQCSEPSLTPEQARLWETVRQLPGVRLRPTPPPPFAAINRLVQRMRFELMSLFVILIGCILYLFIC